MCGICGMIAFDERKAIDPGLLDRMTDSMAHRGPDGRGVWLGDGAGLGHRRLAIIDLEGGSQPWVLDDGAVVFVYNGELYNHINLRKELEAAGVTFRSRCDTEVALKALLHWGVDEALDRFRGMFAFGLWEAHERRLTLARDPIGVKPLYWAVHDGVIRFGSEIKAILTDPSFPRTPDPTAIVNYLAHYRLSFEGRSFFQGIYEVPAAHYIQWNGSRRTEKRYWRAPRIREQDKEDPGKVKAAETFHAKLDLAVRRRLMADVPVGAYLSGGIDSSALVRLMKQHHKGKLQTFSIGFEQQGYNEFAYATAVAQALDIPHKQLTLTEEGYFKEFEELIRIKDTPLSVPNEVPMKFLARIMKSRVSVVLSGEGADELLGGYTHLVRSPHDYLTSLRIMKGKDGLSPQQRGRFSATLQALYGASQFQSQRQQFLPLYQWTPPQERRELIGTALDIDAAEKEIDEFWIKTWDELASSHLNVYENVLHILEEIHLSALLSRLDATTMSWGVEGRVPFTDRDLVEYCFSLPIQYKVRWTFPKEKRQEVMAMTALEVAGKHDVTKYVLRLAFSGQLPQEILLRPKAAFPVPLDRWFFGKYLNWAKERVLTPQMSHYFDLDVLESYLDNKRGKDEGMKLWMLTNLGIWLNEYFS